MAGPADARSPGSSLSAPCSTNGSAGIDGLHMDAVMWGAGQIPRLVRNAPGLILDETVCEQHLIDARRRGYREGLSPIARGKDDDAVS
jgi:hypothetical protein